MVRRAIAGNTRFSLCDVEVERPGLTYTVDTLEELARDGQWFADDYLILGMDALEHFHRWKGPERILQLSRLAVVAREGHQGFSLDRLVDQFRGAAGRVFATAGEIFRKSAPPRCGGALDKAALWKNSCRPR